MLSGWLKTVDGKKRWFTLIFLKMYMAGLLFPSYLSNRLMTNYFKEILFVAATGPQFSLDPKLYAGGKNRLQRQKFQDFALLSV